MVSRVAGRAQFCEHRFISFSCSSPFGKFDFHLLVDEYGRPFIILREQQAKARVKGLEAVRVSIISPQSLACQ